MIDINPSSAPLPKSSAGKSPLERCLLEVYEELRDSLVDPREAFYDDGDGWLPVGSLAGGGGRAAILGEPEHRAIRDECRLLAATNEYAINGHENRISYLVGPGHTYRATIKKGRDVAAELAAEVQSVLDEFIVANHWHRRQQEIVRRYDRDGDFLRFFTADDGTTRVRFVEPGQIATPPSMAGDPASSFGIRTDPVDVETPLVYYVDGQSIDAGEIQHRKANVDSNVKRGLPLFFPVRKNLRRAEKLLRNMSAVAEIQSAIALIRKHRSGTKTGVQQFVANQPEATTVATGGGRTTTARRFGPGTILDAHGGIEYDFPAAGLDAGAFVTILQAELRAIASRLVMPEFMLTSDASNGNYASTLVAEGPAMRMFARLQAELVCDDLQVMWRVIRTAVGSGRLRGEVLDAIEVQATPPSLAVRDQVKEAAVQRIAHDSGILSPQTWSQRQGLDYDQEQMNILAHAKREKSSG